MDYIKSLKRKAVLCSLMPALETQYQRGSRMCPAHQSFTFYPQSRKPVFRQMADISNLSPITLTEQPVLPGYGESKAQGPEDSPFVSQELQFFMLCLQEHSKLQVKVLRLPEFSDSSLLRGWEEYHITEKSDVEEQIATDDQLTLQIYSPLPTKVVLMLCCLSSGSVTTFQK